VFASGLAVPQAKCLFTALQSARACFDSATPLLQLLWVILQGVNNDLKISNWNMWKAMFKKERMLTPEYQALAGIVLPTFEVFSSTNPHCSV
jgi:hypothetical protein